eukprot:scaffold20770_cov108-Skeletonema_menzelii.AAC.1
MGAKNFMISLCINGIYMDTADALSHRSWHALLDTAASMTHSLFILTDKLGYLWCMVEREREREWIETKAKEAAMFNQHVGYIYPAQADCIENQKAAYTRRLYATLLMSARDEEVIGHLKLS